MISLGDMELVLFSSDGASLNSDRYSPYSIKCYLEKEVIGIQDSYMIWLHYRKRDDMWKNFITFSFFEENNEEDVEVKECGVRLICDEDLQQDDVTNLSMFQNLPTLSQHGGAMSLFGPLGYSSWSW